MSASILAGASTLHRTPRHAVIHVPELAKATVNDIAVRVAELAEALLACNLEIVWLQPPGASYPSEPRVVVRVVDPSRPVMMP